MLQKLSPQDQQLLLQAPIYLCLLAAQHDGSLKPKEKHKAIKLTHIKTYMAPRDLKDYFQEVEKHIESDLERIERSLPHDWLRREVLIREQLAEIKTVYQKLNGYYRWRLSRHLKSYTWHISRINQNIMEEVVMPMLIDFIEKRQKRRYFGFDLLSG